MYLLTSNLVMLIGKTDLMTSLSLKERAPLGTNRYSGSDYWSIVHMNYTLYIIDSTNQILNHGSKNILYIKGGVFF